MDFYNSIEKRIEELKKNQYGIIVKKNQKNMLITTSIKFPKEILKKEISEMSIEFLLIIDLYKPKFFPKLYCISPYCYPHFADGRDIFKELPSLKNPKRAFNFSNLLSEILEFIQANFKKGGLYFFGKHYLGGRYDLRMLKKGCDNKNIFAVKESLILNGKSIKLNRLVVLSDVYFLMFEQEKWYKNNLILIFWSSISNIQKIQKVKDNKMVILHWSQKDKENFHMSLTLNQKDRFINNLLDKMHQFGLAYEVKKMDENQENGEKNSKKRKSKELENQNKNQEIINDNNNINNINNKGEGEDENVDNYEEEEEEEDDENEDEENNNKENNQNNEIKDKKKGDANMNNEENNNDDEIFEKVDEEKDQNENVQKLENKVNDNHYINENIKDENYLHQKENEKIEKKEEAKEEEQNKIEDKKEEAKIEQIVEEKNNLNKDEEKKEEIHNNNNNEEKNIENNDNENEKND